MKTRILPSLVRLFATLGLLVALAQPAAGHVRLIDPNGGELLDRGSTFTIEWTIAIAHNLQNWDLELSEDGGVTYSDVAIDLPASSLTYDWTVPDIECSSCRLRITMDNEATNYTDELPVTIVRPTGTDGGTPAPSDPTR